MPIITLLTDFGIEDEYVGIMKGVILSINPLVSIVDISHHVRPQNLMQAAFIIQSTYRYFPAGTIHVVVVDPGVGGDRDIFMLEIKGHTFIAPNNGVLTLLMEQEDILSLTLVNNAEYYLKPVSRTFHGRDIFAPVAAHISSGVALNQVGSSLKQEKVVRLSIPKPTLSGNGQLLGEIVTIDRFGNLITNIKADMIGNLCPLDFQDKVLITVGSIQITGISPSYDRVDPHKPLAIIGSRDCLEIAVNKGNAEVYFGATIGDSVRLQLPDSLSGGPATSALTLRY